MKFYVIFSWSYTPEFCYETWIHCRFCVETFCFIFFPYVIIVPFGTLFQDDRLPYLIRYLSSCHLDCQGLWKYKDDLKRKWVIRLWYDGYIAGSIIADLQTCHVAHGQLENNCKLISPFKRLLKKVDFRVNLAFILIEYELTWFNVSNSFLCE